jgi:hypothetical protein
MRKKTNLQPPAGEQQDKDGIVAISARLTELASRITGVRRGGPQPRSETDAEGRVWPKLPEVRPAQKKTPAAGIEAQPSGIAERDLLIADLTGQQLAQADELRSACAQIDHLIATINALRHEGDRRDLDLATATQKMFDAENRYSELQADLATERQKSAALSQRLIEVETAFNDRLVDFTIHRESAERLSNELILARTEAPKALAAAEVRAHRLFAEQFARLSERHEQQVDELQTALTDQFSQLSAHHEQQLQELQTTIAKRDGEKRCLEHTHVDLALLFCALSDKIAGLETEKEQAAEIIRTQVGQIEFLETSTIIARQNAEATIKELAAEFGRERGQLLARENAAAEIRKNIVQLLPRLIARRDAGDPEAAQVA